LRGWSLEEASLLDFVVVAFADQARARDGAGLLKTLAAAQVVVHASAA
jgi:hypothetical protein